jgi:hypothetical protein
LPGATLYALVLGVFLFIAFSFWILINDARFKNIETYQKLRNIRVHDWQWSFKCILMSALIGAYSHIGLDWLFYEDISNFAVVDYNIFVVVTHSLFTLATVYVFCAICFVIGVFLYYWRAGNGKNKFYRVDNLFNLNFHARDLWVVLALITTPFTIAGIVLSMELGVLLGSNADVVLDMSDILRAIVPALIISDISILITWTGYYKGLKGAGWKLFE